MSKLPKINQFIDLSDYGRPFAKVIARALKKTNYTPIHVTVAFIISGLLAVFCILYNYYLLAAFFLILKSILDAADGELARIKNTPSYTGRYFDSVADILLNAIFIFVIANHTQANYFLALIAFLGVQLQGTLYNYYYVILRNHFNGDRTSRIFENKAPVALEGEYQNNVNTLFAYFKLLYSPFDRFIYWLDKSAETSKWLPNWFMTMVSTLGLGFQLLIIGIMLAFGLAHQIIPFFITYTMLIPVFITIRKIGHAHFNKSEIIL